MDSIQLPLIEELVAVRPGVTQSGKTGKFQAPTGVSDALALCALLASPKPAEQLQSITGSDDVDELVARLRGYGLVLPSTQVPEVDDAGSICWRTVYEVTATDARRINRWLKKSGGRHG